MYNEDMGKRGPKPKKVIDTTWRAELAYAVGLLASDGCLSKDGRHIDLTSADKEQLETFRKCIGLPLLPITTKCGGSTLKKYFRVQVSSVAFYLWLQDIGMTTQKSKTIARLQIPGEFFADFLRGEWDGDGTIVGEWDTRWKSSYYFSIGFASGSRAFLEWLEKEIYQHIGRHGSISEGIRGYQLRYPKEGTLKLFAFMFYNAKVPYLPRKFAKAQKIFSIDAHNAQVVKFGKHAILRG